MRPVGCYCKDICCHITILVILFVGTSGFESNLLYFKDYHDGITRNILHMIHSYTNLKYQDLNGVWHLRFHLICMYQWKLHQNEHLISRYHRQMYYNIHLIYSQQWQCTITNICKLTYIACSKCAVQVVTQ